MEFLRVFVILLSLWVTDTSDRSLPNTIKLNDGNLMPGFGIGTWLGLSRTDAAEGNVSNTELNDGNLMSGFGNETWQSLDGAMKITVSIGEEVQKAVEWAIDAGYRHIDTAYVYVTENQVGRAVHNKIAQGVIKRGDIFITTKLWNTFHAKEDVVPALKESLKNLNMEYVDLYLIHTPVALYQNSSVNPNIDYVETWEGMIEAQKQGLTKSIGVSNFNKSQIDRIINLTNVKPTVLQTEINLNIQQPALLSYCRSKNITVMGYTPFGSLFPQKAKAGAPPPRVDEPALVELAKKYNKTVPQVVLRYLVELDVVPIPKSLTKTRVEQNIQIFDFELTQEERDLLRSYDRNYRVEVIKEWASSPYYPIEE